MYTDQTVSYGGNHELWRKTDQEPPLSQPMSNAVRGQSSHILQTKQYACIWQICSTDSESKSNLHRSATVALSVTVLWREL